MQCHIHNNSATSWTGDQSKTKRATSGKPPHIIDHSLITTSILLSQLCQHEHYHHMVCSIKHSLPEIMLASLRPNILLQ